jgi:hypothetical protein
MPYGIANSFYHQRSTRRCDDFAYCCKIVFLNRSDSVRSLVAADFDCRQPESDHNYLLDDGYQSIYKHLLRADCCRNEHWNTDSQQLRSEFTDVHCPGRFASQMLHPLFHLPRGSRRQSARQVGE